MKDASKNVKRNIYEFIDNSQSVELVVDCENSDPFKLASVLKQLDKSETEKIQKIVLYDDVHTTNAWRYLKAVTGIPVEHNIVERIKYDKSLVDIKMGMGISKAYYKDNVTAFILLSSDSDFWGVISSLPEADFLVMVEEEKCGLDIQNVKDEMGKALAIDTHALIDDIIRNLRMDVSASEKSNFYNKDIRKLRLEIDDNIQSEPYIGNYR